MNQVEQLSFGIGQLSFREILTARQLETASTLCVGLDPELKKFPLHMQNNGKSDEENVYDWAVAIIDSTEQWASTYKPQSAFYESIEGGKNALGKIVRYLEKRYPYIPVLEDCKRGDIGNTQAQYRIAAFHRDKVGAMNFSPYMGKECMSDLFDPMYPGRGIIGLGYTSNPSGRPMQEVRLASGEMYYQFVMRNILEWSYEIGINENGGLVVGAAYDRWGEGQPYTEHLKNCRKIVGDKLFLLVPGIGAQIKGVDQALFVEATVRDGWAGWGSMIINSSREIIYASNGLDFAEAAAFQAEKLHLEIHKAIIKLIA
ncbi:MAG: orotidine-5'-phosphate decarboxylase [Candidatus Paceibacterota bacterium]